MLYTSKIENGLNGFIFFLPWPLGFKKNASYFYWILPIDIICEQKGNCVQVNVSEG